VAERAVPVSGFTLVRNATLLDFPLEASIHSLLPGVDELVVNVGASGDDTRDRVCAIGDSRIRIVDSEWDTSQGPGMLAVETQRAMNACRHAWGIYIQADEVLEDGGALRLAQLIGEYDKVAHVEGIVVKYRHFYGGFDHVAANRRWYRREVRAVRLDRASDIRSYRDAQGFRAGAGARRIRAVISDVTMEHYGWARPAWALTAKRAEDRALAPEERSALDGRPLLPWFPGIRPFVGEHPAVAREWIAARRSSEQLIAPKRIEREHYRLAISGLFERITGLRPFEFRNYTRA
jgi:hypothetical protein